MRRTTTLALTTLVVVTATAIEGFTGAHVLGIGTTLIGVILILAYRNSLVAPSCLFVFTYWLFLVSRHFLADVGLAPYEMVIGSSGYDPGTLFLERFLLAASLWIIGFSYYFLALPGARVYSLVEWKGPLVLDLIQKTKVPALIALIVTAPILAHSCATMASAITTEGYASAMEEDLSHFSVVAYTILKWSWIFLFVAYRDRPRIRVGATIVFLIALAFTLTSGLRGYFFIYALFVLLGFEATGIFKVRAIFAPILATIGLATATELLEYRLRYAIAGAGLWPKVQAGMWAQGVSTEVFYGAVEQWHKLSFAKDVLLQRWFGYDAFGYTLDHLRGVNFAGNAGLASSGLAEAYAGGWWTLIFTLLVLGAVLRFLDVCFESASENPLNLVVLFYLFPTVVYFPRASWLPLMVKSFLIALALWLVGLPARTYSTNLRKPRTRHWTRGGSARC